MQKQKVSQIEMLWTTDKEFQKQIKEIRHDYGFSNAHSIIEFETERNLVWNNEKRGKFMLHLFELVFKYKLYGWETELEYFIGTGNTYLPDAISAPQIAQIDGELQVSFSIKKLIDKTNLHEWIDNNWLAGENFANAVKNQFSFPLILEEYHVKDFGLIKRLIELKEKEKKKFSEIANTLVQEFNINDPEARINEGSVKTMYHEYKKYADRLKKRDIGLNPS